MIIYTPIGDKNVGTHQLQNFNWLNGLVCKKTLKFYQRAHQFKNLNLLFLTKKHHTPGWGQIIKPTHIVMLFFESILFVGWMCIGSSTLLKICKLDIYYLYVYCIFYNENNYSFIYYIHHTWTV